MNSNLRTLRLQLVEADRLLRNRKDDLIATKAECEQCAIDSGKSSGKNAEERERSMALALASDQEYQLAIELLRDAEWTRDRAEALLEAAKDERRAAEWQIRCKLADGLFGAGVQSDHEDYAGDSAFDDVADEHLTRAAVAAQGDINWWDNLPKSNAEN